MFCSLRVPAGSLPSLDEAKQASEDLAEELMGEYLSGDSWTNLDVYLLKVVMLKWASGPVSCPYEPQILLIQNFGEHPFSNNPHLNNHSNTTKK